MHYKSTVTIKATKVKKRQPRKKVSTLPEIGVIVEAIKEKKGEKVKSIDLTKINDAACDYFIICEATSTTQVKAIADNIIYSMEEETGNKPWHFEGMQNQQWILLDFVNIVVHVFLSELRAFYQIEELWSDGIIAEHND